eukprot:c17934_g1_i1 orf=292-1701(-)
MEVAAHQLQQPYCSPSSPTGKPFHQQCSCCKDCNDSSSTSTPYVSAPSSPRRSTALGYYLARSALTVSTDSESHDIGYTASAGTEAENTPPLSHVSSDFDFSARFLEAESCFCPSTASTMSSAEELFFNGKIRPLNTSSYCICFNGAAHDGYCNPSVALVDAYARRECGKSPSPHAEQNYYHYDQQQQPPPLRKQRSGHSKPTSTLSALEQWKKSMGKHDKGHAHAQHAERGMQIYSSLPLACYSNGNGGGHHRRARSLSPLRVFHMDDMMRPRVSFESEIYTNMSSHAEVDHHDVGIIRPRRSRKSWTLKELLNMGDNKVHDRRPQFGGEFNHLEPSSLQYDDNKYEDYNQVGNVQPAKSEEKGTIMHKLEDKISFKCAGNKVGKTSLAEEIAYSKSSTHSEWGARSPWEKAMVGHAQHYYTGSQRANAEEMKKRTFLPYKKGLLGCLGFTAKLSSIKGLHAMNPNPR